MINDAELVSWFQIQAGRWLHCSCLK